MVRCRPMLSGLHNGFSSRVTGFHRQSKIFELNFFAGKGNVILRSYRALTIVKKLAFRPKPVKMGVRFKTAACQQKWRMVDTFICIFSSSFLVMWFNNDHDLNSSVFCLASSQIILSRQIFRSEETFCVVLVLGKT